MEPAVVRTVSKFPLHCSSEANLMGWHRESPEKQRRPLERRLGPCRSPYREMMMMMRGLCHLEYHSERTLVGQGAC